jgi:hypothetical protein
MKITWVIEPEMWEGHKDEMFKATAVLGHDLVCTDVALERPLPKISGSVVVHGSFELAKKVYSETNWTPGVICTLENYLWSFYAPKLPQDIKLNDNWGMKNASDLVKQAEAKQLNDCFIRPDAGNKPFPGTPFFGDRTLWPAMTRMFLRYGGDIPVIISPLKTIFDEYRMVVIGGNVVTGSRYMREGLIDIGSGAPQEAFDVAEKAIGAWQPDIAFVVDVASTPEGYKVVEYNAFSTADWYGCDVLPILKSVDTMLGK